MQLDAPIETPRLFIRPIVEPDADDIYEIDTDAEMMRYIEDGRPKTWSREQGHEQLLRYIRQVGPSPWGFLTVVAKPICQFVGLVGLMPDPHVGAIELAFRIIRREQGRGYATEAGEAMLRHGFERCALDRIVASTQEGNAAGQRVLEKLGFAPIGQRIHDQSGRTVHIHCLDRAHFLNRQQAQAHNKPVA